MSATFFCCLKLHSLLPIPELADLLVVMPAGYIRTSPRVAGGPESLSSSLTKQMDRMVMKTAPFFLIRKPTKIQKKKKIKDNPKQSFGAFKGIRRRKKLIKTLSAATVKAERSNEWEKTPHKPITVLE